MWWIRWWTRRYLRSMMKPMSEERAERILKNLRYFYFFLGWNTLMVALYGYKKHKKLRAEQGFIDDISDAHKHLRLSNAENTTIYRIGWGQPIQKYEFNREEYIQQQAAREKITRTAYLEKKEKEIREAQQLPDDDDSDDEWLKN